jgi:hypothetical protein
LQAAQLGWLFTLGTGGSLLALAVLQRTQERPRGQLMVYAGCCLGLAYILLSLCHTYWMILGCRILTQGAVTAVHLTWTTLRQAATPPHLRGRVGSATWVVTLLALPCSALLTGVIVPSVGVVPIFIAAGCFTICASASMGVYSP